MSVVANFVVKNEDDEFEYLQNYFGETPNEYMQARFFLMKQLLHVFYMSIFFLNASKSLPIIIENININFNDFHKAMWEGKIDLSKDENKLDYALVHMKQFLLNLNNKLSPKFLKIVFENRRE